MTVSTFAMRASGRELLTALLLAALVASGVLCGLAWYGQIRQTISLAAASHLPLHVAQGDWLRKATGWESLPHAEVRVRPEVRPFQEISPFPEVRPFPEFALAQRLLVAHVVERYRIDSDHAATVVALAYRVADELRIDPLLVLAVISVESSFDRFAQSRRGAQGLMQVRTQVHADRFEPFGGSDAAFDPDANIRVGAELLRIHLLREGSTEAALKAYVGAARRPHDSGYGARVLRARDALSGVIDGLDEVVLRAVPDGPDRIGSGS